MVTDANNPNTSYCLDTNDKIDLFVTVSSVTPKLIFIYNRSVSTKQPIPSVETVNLSVIAPFWSFQLMPYLSFSSAPSQL